MSGRIRATVFERRRCAGEAGRATREGVAGISASPPRMEYGAIEGDVDLRVVCRVPRRFLVTTAPALGEDSSDSSLQQSTLTDEGTNVNNCLKLLLVCWTR